MSKITKKRLEWNPDHKSPDEQEMDWVMEFLMLPFDKKWIYLMNVCRSVPKENPKGKRLEWI